MPLYDYQCESHGVFESFRRVGDGASASCPTCRGDSPRTYAGTRFTFDRSYDQVVDGEMPNADKPTVVKRAGDGAMVKNQDTGMYRAAVTHHTICPREKTWRNVAVLGEFSYGTRLNCEACAHVWLYNGTTTDTPLNHGVVESYRPGQKFFMNSGRSSYTAPARGA